ncbi:MAG: PilT/PilU family type 4a pilus ATPase [Solirubrobacterales bacterium]
MAFDLQAALRMVVEQEGSDLHLKVPSPPRIRIKGMLHPVEGAEPLTPDDTEKVLREMLTASDRLSEFARDGEIDFSYTVGGLARFRVNAFRQRGSISIVCRVVPFTIKTIDELELPDVIKTLADESRGIILVTGTTGSGKSTTLAAMIDQINSTHARNIVTIEDPIEYLHRDRKSIVHQREVGFDTNSFAQALRRVLRQDPDVILIGEMRDEETVATALSAAETGHLVFSTLHTIDAVETINRIIDFFPPHQHQQIRAMLGGSLKGVVSQRLIPTADGEGRVPAVEVMTMTGRVRDLIEDSNETGKLSEVIAEGGYYGMQTFDQHLLELYQKGKISYDVALVTATHPHDFNLLVAAEGQRSTGVEQLYDDVGEKSRGPGGDQGPPPPAAPDAKPDAKPAVDAASGGEGPEASDGPGRASISVAPPN